MKKFKKIKIFFTGATGFLGSNLIEYLAQSTNLNFDITALTRDKKKAKKIENLGNLKINWIEKNILDLKHEVGNYDIFFHLACPSAEETYNGMDSVLKFNTIVHGTQNALEFAVKSKIKKFIFTSSGAVYGDYSKKYKYVPESFIPSLDYSNPNNALGISKKVAEFLCLNYAQKYNFETSIFRCFSFVGKNLPLSLHYAIGNFILQASKKNKIILNGPKDTFRSYLHVSDFCEWITTVGLSKNKNNIYNLGSDKAISMFELAKIIANKFDKKIEIKSLNKKESVGNLYRKYYIPNMKLMKNQFNLVEKHDLQFSINEILKNF